MTKILSALKRLLSKMVDLASALKRLHSKMVDRVSALKNEEIKKVRKRPHLLCRICEKKVYLIKITKGVLMMSVQHFSNYYLI